LKLSLVRKLVLGFALVSITTYGTSALFIFSFKSWLAPDMKDSLYYLFVLALGIFWTCLLGWIAARFIVKPLLQLTTIVNTVAAGNLNVTIPDRRSQDEIGTLNHSFQVMLGNLRQMIMNVTDNVSITDQSIHTLGSAIKQATTQIETIAHTVDRMADDASSQASSADEMVQTAQHTAEAAQSINDGAEQAIQVADTMVLTISESTAQIRSLVSGMQHISDTSENTLQIVRSLELQANEISQISLMVKQIADQTHLLALNASIEAAHAGEQGQGFAVVAGHIRKLASDSAAAGDQINALVSQMQVQTLTVVQETDKQVELVRNETAIGEQARASLDHVVHAVNETASALQNIVKHINVQTEQINHTFEKAKQMAATSASISDGGSNIATAVQEQTAVMEEITASSELLRDEAESLKQKTVMFKL